MQPGQNYVLTHFVTIVDDLALVDNTAVDTVRYYQAGVRQVHCHTIFVPIDFNFHLKIASLFKLLSTPPGNSMIVLSV